MSLPYVVGDMGYTLGTTGDDTMSLYAFKVDTAKQEWKLALGKPQGNMNNRGMREMATPAMLESGGMLFIATNNGALIAVNTAQHRVEWAFRHDTKYIDVTRGWWGYVMPTFEMPPTLMMHEGALYVKDSGGRMIYALDPSGPSVKWKRVAEPEEMMLSIEGHTAYLLGHYLSSVDMKTGVLNWSPKLPVLRSNIEPLETLGHVYVSTDRGIVDIDKHRQLGDPPKIFRGADHEGSGGRLMMTGDKLICVTDRAVTAYVVKAEGGSQKPEARGQKPEGGAKPAPEEMNRGNPVPGNVEGLSPPIILNK
jgi:hypothetical protein